MTAYKLDFGIHVHADTTFLCVGWPCVNRRGVASAIHPTRRHVAEAEKRVRQPNPGFFDRRFWGGFKKGCIDFSPLFLADDPDRFKGIGCLWRGEQKRSIRLGMNGRSFGRRWLDYQPNTTWVRRNGSGEQEHQEKDSVSFPSLNRL
jgi:hypothetical protein